MALDFRPIPRIVCVGRRKLLHCLFGVQDAKRSQHPETFTYLEFVEEGGRTCQGLYVQNVGLVPAKNVRVEADIEEWREGGIVESRFHESYDAFHDHLVTIGSQEHRLYELPAIEGWALTVTVLAACSSGPSDSAHFVVGDDVLGFPIRTKLCATHGKRHCRREAGNGGTTWEPRTVSAASARATPAP